MGKIKQSLIVCIGVYSSNQPGNYTKSVQYYFGYRGETVGGAGGVRYDVVTGWIVVVFIDPHHNRDVLMLCRGCDYDFLCSGLQMPACKIRITEPSGSFNYVFHTHFLPRQLGWFLDSCYPNIFAVHNYSLICVLHIKGECSHYRIIL